MNAGVHGDTLTAGRLLLQSASKRPDKIAIAAPNEAWSYAELERRALEVACGLMALGVEPQDRVGLLLPNGLDFAACWFGISLAGAVIVPINARYQSPELAYVLAHAEVKCLLTTDAIAEHVDFLALLAWALPGLSDAGDAARLNIEAAPHLRAVVNLGKGRARWWIDRETFIHSAGRCTVENVRARHDAVDPRSLAALVFTSGTTSRPKACMHPQRGLLHNWLAAKERLQVTEADVIWNPLPLFHGQAYGMMMATIDAGGTFLTQTHFDPAVALDLIEHYGATLLYPGFPAITTRLIEHPRFATMKRSSIRGVMAISSPSVWSRTQAAFTPAAQFSAYGLQEGGGVLSYADLTEPEPIRRDTCGRPLTGVEIRIVDPATGTPLPAGSSGEILVRGPGCFTGYYRDPQATAAMLDREGFLHTGDLGVLDATGRIIYKDRIKSMLKVGGENIAPSEIETVLLTHPLVIAAVVVGIPDDRLDQVPAAFVELRPGQTASPEEIVEHCRRRLARFKVPRIVRFVTEWPMSATKVQSSRLRNQLIRELSQAQSDGQPS